MYKRKENINIFSNGTFVLSLNCSYGDMFAHNLLWRECARTSGNVAARLAVIPLVQVDTSAGMVYLTPREPECVSPIGFKIPSAIL